MLILHVSHFDRMGGACIAAYRQHQALRLHGVDSRMWVRHKVTADPFVSAHEPPAALLPRARRLARRYWLNAEMRRARWHGEIFDDRTDHGGQETCGMPDCDIINIQFSQGFLDHPRFFETIPDDIPIVVTLHEMSWFTGGCSYAGPCTRFHQQCGECPQLGAAGPNDFSARGWRRRRKSFASRPQGKLHFVADSQWIAEQAQKSGLLHDYPVQVIHYGLDTEIFKPIDKGAARAAFGIPVGLPVVAFCAVSVTDERKGMRYLVEAVKQMPEKPFLLTWGRSFPTALEGVPHLHLGNIDSEHLMAVTYNAADVFVMPSLEEAFGQTALEALACGLPVVAFATGGIPDMIRDGENGLLVEVGSASELAAAILRLIKDSDLRFKMGNNARQLVKSAFSFEKNAHAYVQLYRKLLENKSE